MNITVSQDANENWDNDHLQFARLIAELEAAGAFTPAVVRALTKSMDLDEWEVRQVIDRAQLAWDDVKAHI